MARSSTRVKAVRPRAAFWRRQIKAWMESGLTQTEFCDERSLSVSALRWWKWELGRRGELDCDPAEAGKPERTARSHPRFVPVRLLDPGISTCLESESPFEIVLRNGYRIRIAANDFDSEALQRLIRTVEGS